LSIFSEQVTRLQTGLNNAKIAIEGKDGVVVVGNTTPTIEEIVTGIGTVSAGIESSLISNVTSCQSMYAGNVLWVNFPATEFTNSLTTEGMFNGCTSLVTVGELGLPLVTDITSMFQGCTSITSVGELVGTGLTVADYAFKGCDSLTSQPVFDLQGITSAIGMFEGCTFSPVDFRNWDTTGVTLTDIVKDCTATVGYAKTQADADRLNASTGKPAGLVFEVFVEPYYAVDADFSGTSNGYFEYIGLNTDYVVIPKVIKGVTWTYSPKFDGGSYSYNKEPGKIKRIKLEDPSSVVSLQALCSFNYAETLKIEGGATTNPVSMAYLCQNSLTKKIDLKDLSFANLTNAQSMFDDSLAEVIELPIAPSSNLTNATKMFNGTLVDVIDVSNIDFANVPAANTNYFCCNSSATVGLTKNQADADKLNASSYKPSTLTFIPKPENYVYTPPAPYIAVDADFSGTTNGSFVYTGTNLDFVKIPRVIKGVTLTSYAGMFYGRDVKKVSAVDASGVTSTRDMFKSAYAGRLDLSELYLPDVTDAGNMFLFTKNKVINLCGMLMPRVTNFVTTFQTATVKVLDFSTIDLTNLVSTDSMFLSSSVIKGYARNADDAAKLNASSSKPAGLIFVVKPT